MKSLWPHQRRGIDATTAALQAGERRVCLTSPTGGGKSRMICEVIEEVVAQGWYAVLYTNRKMLVDQLSKSLSAHGLKYGVRAAGHEADLDMPVQISSLATEFSRTLKKGDWQPHGGEEHPTLVCVDECHVNGGRQAKQLFDWHVARGGRLLGVTATPIDIGDVYTKLIVAGTNSELRACGALVLAHHYGPDEPDLRHIGKVQVGQDLTEKQNAKAIMREGIFGRVLTWFRKLNPESKPTILFAPGVPESVWFAEQFWREGITAAHIDGESVWVNGQFYATSASAREDVLKGSGDGSIKVLCNRFVLREGVDAPWLAHGILATVFGSLQSYLQSGGRLLRSHCSLSEVTIQDHGGNWHRHGSLNADRCWELDCTAAKLAAAREQQLREKTVKEPIVCPRCFHVLTTSRCPCGFEVVGTVKSRPVIMADGELREMKGDIYKARTTREYHNTQSLWDRCYYGAKKGKKGLSFRQAEAWFFKLHHYWPPRTIKRMPLDEADWFRKVKDIPTEGLRT